MSRRLVRLFDRGFEYSRSGSSFPSTSSSIFTSSTTIHALLYLYIIISILNAVATHWKHSLSWVNNTSCMAADDSTKRCPQSRKGIVGLMLIILIFQVYLAYLSYVDGNVRELVANLVWPYF